MTSHCRWHVEECKETERLVRLVILELEDVEFRIDAQLRSNTWFSLGVRVGSTPLGVSRTVVISEQPKHRPLILPLTDLRIYLARATQARLSRWPTWAGESRMHGICSNRPWRHGLCRLRVQHLCLECVALLLLAFA